MGLDVIPVSQASSTDNGTGDLGYILYDAAPEIWVRPLFTVWFASQNSRNAVRISPVPSQKRFPVTAVRGQNEVVAMPFVTRKYLSICLPLFQVRMW